MKRSIFVAGVLCLGLGSAMAAPPPADTTATLKVYRWTTDADIKMMEGARERFKAKYPNVTVEVQYGPNGWGDYINNFMNLVASGDVPDIVAMPIEGIPTVASRDLLVNLEEVSKEDPEAQAILGDIEPNLLDGLRWNGVLSFFPTEWNSIVVYYNVAMFKEAGVEPPKPDWTWEDFRATAQKLTKRDAAGNVTQYGFFVPGENFGLAPFLFTNDTDKLTADWKESNAKDPKLAESLQFLHDLINKDKVAPGFVRKDFGIAAFAAGQTAMMVAGRWPTPDLMGSKIDFDVQSFPRNKKDVTVFGVGGNAITRASANPELAWEFVKEISGKDFQQGLVDGNRAIPSLRSLATSPAFVAIPHGHGGLFYDTAAVAKPVASPPNFAQVEDIFMRNVDAYLTNNQDLAATVETMDADLTRSMRRVKW